MSFFSVLNDLLHPAPPPSEAVLRALGRIGELVDPLLPTLGAFEKTLAGPVAHVLGYCDGLVAALPGPMEITRTSFANDPLVHALFATASDIEQMIGRSQAIRDFLHEPRCWESEHFYAMLAARRQEKHQLGIAEEGGVMHSEVPQTVLYFSDHTLIEPSCQLEETLRGLRCKAFESLLHTFRSHVDALRASRDELRADVAEQRSHLFAPQAHPAEAATRHFAELSEALRTQAESLMPEQVLQALADYLMHPETALRLTPVSLSVDRLGVIQHAADPLSGAQTITFPELTARDRRLHLGMLVRIERTEALAAVEAVSDQQHRYMII